MSAMPLLFPADPAPGDTTLAFAAAGDQQPQVTWAGTATGGEDAASFAAVGGAVVGSALAPEQSSGLYTRPGLRGHRLAGAAGGADADADGDSAAGRDWTPAFQTTDAAVRDGVLAIDLADPAAGLALRTEVESLPGGSLRARHTLINTGADPFVVDGLEVVFPLDERLTEILDFTGRWGYEHAPQRRPLSDGLWLRENRRGKTGHDSAMVTVVGTPGFDFDRGAVLALHVAWSGNSVHRVERSAATQAALGGGELLLPGEVVLDAGQSYSTPWVHLVAATDGLDGVAASFHRYQRSMPSHPGSPRPVNLNVWEAVYFDHDLPRLLELADLAARLGVERYVLDDGWFRHRRGDSAGLGDWYVDEDVWPRGLAPLIDRVRANGMRFGLWFEPEMVNPDSDLFRAHPDWVLSARDRLPVLQRNQLVLDLSRPEVGQYLLERIDSVLSEYDISYVKWDHNRDLLEAGSGTRAGGPAVHAHTLGFYALLDELRRRHPAGGVGVVRQRRRPRRPGHPGAGRADLDLGHDRRAEPAVHPALDRAARGAGVPGRARVHAGLPPDRARAALAVPRGHRAVRPLRDRVGPHGHRRGRPRRFGRVDRPLKGPAGSASQRPGGARPVGGPGDLDPWRGVRGPPPGADGPRPARRVRPGTGHPAAGAGPGPRHPVPGSLGRPGPGRGMEQHRGRSGRPGGDRRGDRCGAGRGRTTDAPAAAPLGGPGADHRGVSGTLAGGHRAGGNNATGPVLGVDRHEDLRLSGAWVDRHTCLRRRVWSGLPPAPPYSAQAGWVQARETRPILCMTPLTGRGRGPGQDGAAGTDGCGRWPARHVYDWAQARVWRRVWERFGSGSGR